MIGLLFAVVAAMAMVLGAPAIQPAQAQGAPQTVVPTRTLGPVPTTPPGKETEQQGPAHPPHGAHGQPAAAPGGSVSDLERQAVDESKGVFPPMARLGAGGQIQEAWNEADAHAGVYEPRLCENCVYKVRTREFMVTTLELPEGAVITKADLGDPVGFAIEIRGANLVAVRPSVGGVDSNLNVYTKAGMVYAFYIRSENFNSNHVPDLMVRILGREKPSVIVAAADGDAAGTAPDPQKMKATPKDFVGKVPFDPAALHGWSDYDLRGDEELKPEIVYRDTVFTYIHYSKAQWQGGELPTAYVVRDGIDELVNSHVKGSTFVVEAVAPLITLKLGKKFLCVQYTGAAP